MVERNLKAPPAYLANIADQDDRELTDMGTANPTYLAYYKEANKYGNIDVVYPRRGEESDYHDDVDSTISSDSLNSATSSPDLNIFHYLLLHDICGLEEHIIGFDSEDGMTWL